MRLTATSIHRAAAVVIASLAIATAGCGKYVRDQGTAPAQVVIMSMQAASGADPGTFGVPLSSDVLTKGTVFNDLGEVTMQLILKDPGQVGTTGAPSPINQVTFDRYHVEFVRSDGRNTQGVDVPYAFDSAVTFTVPASGTVTQPFDLVRQDAKREAPLAALQSNSLIIAAIANVTFYGHDQAGNGVTATGSIQVNFGNFADPS
jgi:hypothetical protein